MLKPTTNQLKKQHDAGTLRPPAIPPKQQFVRERAVHTGSITITSGSYPVGDILRTDSRKDRDWGAIAYNADNDPALIPVSRCGLPMAIPAAVTASSLTGRQQLILKQLDP